MKLTIEQALQKGIAAHKEGSFQEAEQSYHAILQIQPRHPDANHNLGLIAVSVNKVELALPLFKTALEANPKIEQFWLSYIDALIKENQLETVKNVLAEAKKIGLAGDKVNALENQFKQMTQSKDKSTNVASPSQSQLNNLLELFQSRRYSKVEKLAVLITEQFPQHPYAWNLLGLVFEAVGRTSEAFHANQKYVMLSPLDANAHYNFGITLQKLSRLEEAEASYTLAISLKPDFAEAHFNMGATLKGLGRLEEAEASYTLAISLKPDFAEAHNNLGTILQELGRLEEAEASYKQAIALQPDSAEAHSNLGATLQKLGRLEDAQASCRKTTVLKPDFAEGHFNLGITLQKLGRLDQAITAYIQAIGLKPDYTPAITNVGLALKNVDFKSSNRSLYPILINLLTTGNCIRPRDLARSIISLMKHEPLIKNLLTGKNVIRGPKEVTSIIETLDKLPLLHHLMRLCPLPDLPLEGLFVTIRKILLRYLNEIEISPKLIYFLSTLSLQCFTNEYIYFESDEETQLVSDLEIKISQAIAQSEQPQLIEILCLATYRPLHRYDWCDKQKVLNQVTEVKMRLIEEPIAQKVIKKDIPILEVISDDVSLQVRKQYEENPYPRWVNLSIPARSISISEMCDDVPLKLHSNKIRDISDPEILIAGCGTGQHSIGTASRFSDCQVLAVDLSLASLAYAKRKTNELGISNLNYMQADIIDLYRLDREFDVIESSGVLHHMEEPMAGWKVLTDRLKPGGLMKIGLYSELARSYIVKIRKEIESLGIGTSEAQIRKLRQSLIQSENKAYKPVISYNDFYSLSELRDALFHVQEHRFSIPQIHNCIEGLGLKFCGFEDEDIISKFKAFHGDGSDIYDLTLWHHFEISNPHTFICMYQFWCQKL